MAKDDELFSNMDFGSMLELSDDGFLPTEPEIPKDQQGEEEPAKPKDETELNIDINSILAGQLDESKDEDDRPKDDEDSVDDNKTPESKKKKESPDSSDKTDEEDDSGVPFTLVFARHQLEQGNLSDLDEEELLKVIEEDGEGAAMSYLFNKEVELNRQAYLDQYEKDAKELREYMELKDAGVDTETAKNLVGTMAAFEKVKVEDLEDEEKVELRRSIITQNYKNSTKFSDAKIRKIVENSISLGEDIDEAKEALENIKEFNAEAVKAEKKRVEEDRKAAETSEKRTIDTLKESINKIDEVFPGHKINKQTKKKIEDALLKPAGKDQTGRPLNAVWTKRSESPMDFDIKLAYLLASGFFDGKMDKITKTEKTKAVSEIEKAIKRGHTTVGGKPKSSLSDEEQDLRDSIAATANAFGIK